MQLLNLTAIEALLALSVREVLAFARSSYDIAGVAHFVLAVGIRVCDTVCSESAVPGDMKAAEAHDEAIAFACRLVSRFNLEAFAIFSSVDRNAFAVSDAACVLAVLSYGPWCHGEAEEDRDELCVLHD